MPFDYNSFLQGVQTGLRLGRTTPGRQPPFPPVPSGKYILTESGKLMLTEIPDYEIGVAVGNVETTWEQPIPLYSSATVRWYRGGDSGVGFQILAEEGCVVLVRYTKTEESGAVIVYYGVAADHPGRVGTRVESGGAIRDLYADDVYTFQGKSVYYTTATTSFWIANDYIASFPSVPEDKGEIDGLVCWVAIYGDILLGTPMITEGNRDAR